MSTKSGYKRLVDKSALDRLSDGFRGFLDALVQIVENAVDWSATRIVLRFYESGGTPCMDVIDDGGGMDPKGEEAYRSLCKSEARGDTTKKGRNGTGRLGFIHHALECRTVTKIAGGSARHLTMHRENMFMAWFEEGPNLEWSDQHLPLGHPLLTSGSGTVVTWYDLRVGSPQAQSQRKPARVIEELADKLAPNVGRKVTVCVTQADGQTKGHPLKPREIKGKPIEGTHELPSVGGVHWSLFVVARSDRSIDHVMIGAMGPVCSWAHFIQPFLSDRRYRELARLIDAVLRHPQVVGHIDIPRLNDFAVGERKSFGADLLDDALLGTTILEYLRGHLVPLVETELGMRSDEIVTTDDTTLIQDICKLIHQATGQSPDRRDVIHIEVNRTRVDLTPGESYDFKIERPIEGATYQWDASESRGTLSKRRGTRVTFTASELGKGRLVVSMMGVVGYAPQPAIINLNIMPHLPMKFSRPIVCMGLNDRRLVRLEHVPEHANLTWETQDWGGELHIEEDRTQAVVLSGDREGDFDITVTDQEPGDEVANCTIRIERDHGDTPRKTSTLDDEIILEDQIFRIISTRMKGTTDANSHVSWLERGEGMHGITLNLDHPSLDLPSDPARKAIIMREIALRAAEGLLPEATVIRDILDKAGILSATLMAGLSARLS